MPAGQFHLDRHWVGCSTKESAPGCDMDEIHPRFSVPHSCLPQSVLHADRGGQIALDHFDHLDGPASGIEPLFQVSSYGLREVSSEEALEAELPHELHSCGLPPHA